MVLIISERRGKTRCAKYTAPFAVGAATWGLASTVGNWGLGYGAWGYNTAYANPYYASIPAAVVAASCDAAGRPRRPTK
jgi:hypothetical protein